MQDYRKILTEFYEKHNPEKVAQVDDLLEKYKGNEEALIKEVHAKYGVPYGGIPSRPTLRKEEGTNEPGSQPASPAGQASGGAKKDWEKKREEILRQVKERSEKLRKERATRDQTAEPKEPTDQESKTEPVSPQPEEPEKERQEEPPPTSSFEKKEEKKAPKEPSSKKEEPQPFLQQTSSTESSAQITSKKKEDRPAARPTDESNYSWKALFIAILIVGVLAGTILIIRSDFAHNLFSGDNKQPTEQKEKKPKKKTMEPNVLADREAEAEDEANSEDNNPEDESFALEDEPEDETGEDVFDSEMNKEDHEETDYEDELFDETPEKETTSTETNKTLLEPGELHTPCYVIGYSAVAQKSLAKQQATTLNNKGFKSGYYYIPDHFAGGKALYKVYVGPFNSQSEAEQSLASVQQYNPGSYVLRVP